jgi:hypothetical protein
VARKLLLPLLQGQFEDSRILDDLSNHLVHSSFTATGNDVPGLLQELEDSKDARSWLFLERFLLVPAPKIVPNHKGINVTGISAP